MTDGEDIDWDLLTSIEIGKHLPDELHPTGYTREKFKDILKPSLKRLGVTAVDETVEKLVKAAMRYNVEAARHEQSPLVAELISELRQLACVSDEEASHVCQELSSDAVETIFGRGELPTRLLIDRARPAKATLLPPEDGSLQTIKSFLSQIGQNGRATADYVQIPFVVALRRAIPRGYDLRALISDFAATEPNVLRILATEALLLLQLYYQATGPGLKNTSSRTTRRWISSAAGWGFMRDVVAIVMPQQARPTPSETEAIGDVVAWTFHYSKPENGRPQEQRRKIKKG